MPNNHDETLEQRYAREPSEHLAELTKRTPEEIAYMEQLLHNVLAERDQLATKVADTELALFAENQKRQDVERQRDQLLAVLEKVVGAGTWYCTALEVVSEIDGEELEKELKAAIAAVKGGQCQTCNGNGMIGGPSYSQPDEGGEPCPDCQPPAVAVPEVRMAVPDGLLSADDMKNLLRFAECCEDPEAGGHDVPKAAMKRLELAGAVRSCGFGRHETTAFGNAMLSAAQKQGGA